MFQKKWSELIKQLGYSQGCSQCRWSFKWSCCVGLSLCWFLCVLAVCLQQQESSWCPFCSAPMSATCSTCWPGRKMVSLICVSWNTIYFWFCLLVLPFLPMQLIQWLANIVLLMQGRVRGSSGKTWCNTCWIGNLSITLEIRTNNSACFIKMLLI